MLLSKNPKSNVLRLVPDLCENILPYINEVMSVVRPFSVSHMFNLQPMHIAPPFQLLQKFHWYKFYVLLTNHVENVEVIIDA